MEKTQRFLFNPDWLEKGVLGLYTLSIELKETLVSHAFIGTGNIRLLAKSNVPL